MTAGTLIVQGKTLQVRFITTKEKEVTFNIAEAELSTPLLEKKQRSIADLNNLSVELEVVQGQPKQIREPGKVWERPPANSRPVQGGDPARPQQRQQPQPPINHNVRREFHNPYNFVPALPRDRVTGELGDRAPKGHGAYHDDYWSGRIAVKLTTKTPLLIPDAARATEQNEHKTYPIRLGPDGKPYLPPTSLKGMLRTAYEAVTNSRLSVLEKHSDRLAYRMPAQQHSSLFPARVERRGQNLVLRIMETNLPGHAAKLPRYRRDGFPPNKGEQAAALRYEGTNLLPQHGDAVWVQVNAAGTVTKIRQRSAAASPGRGWQKGWACITGANIKDKANERVFLESSSDEFIPAQSLKPLWEELVRNYQKTHEKDLEKRRVLKKHPSTYLGSKPGETGFSRHVYDANELTLDEGRLCYVEFEDDVVKALIPVTLSRRLYSTPPEKLLDSSLKPAMSIDALSPADRVFGWVNQSGKGAYKGQLRIQSVTCLSEDAVEKFGAQGFPLAILGQPKPQQTRFYTASDAQGSALAPGAAKQDGYRPRGGLRGRKVYPHHRQLPESYWKNPTEDRTQIQIGGQYQEYRRPLHNGVDRDNQNRSIQAWVKPETSFQFSIDVLNLSAVELGALLWLLNLPKDHYHRMGGAKPLGFGSVQLEIDWSATDLRPGQDWRSYYNSLVGNHTSTQAKAESTVNEFKQALAAAYGNGFDNLRFIQAFQRAAKGFEDGKPIHYPRTQPNPNPAGEAFEWFVDNERVGKSGGFKVPLSPLWNDEGLPLHPAS